MREMREIIEIDEELCDGCGICVPNCEEGALEIVDGKARLVAQRYCDGLGACLGHCPTGALQIITQEADEFDEQAVRERMAGIKEQTQAPAGCPSMRPLEMPACDCANKPTAQSGPLGNWPIQIRLVTPQAPFLKNADLLIAADCVPPAAPGPFNQELAGKVLLMGCPKFDDAESYVQRLAEIFETCSIRSVTTMEMEVPCCSALRAILGQALAVAGEDMETRSIVVSRQGAAI